MKGPVDVVCVGNVVVDFVVGPLRGLPAWGTLVETPSRLEPAIGGNGAIFSVAAARLGLKSALVGKVGRDFFGDWLVSQLAGEGVLTAGLGRGAKGTSSTVALVNEEGERGFLHYIGANAALNTDDLAALPRCRWLHISSVFLLPGLSAKAIGKTLRAAKKSGAVTSLDVAWDPKGRWDLGDCLEQVDYFLPNIDEAREITGKDDFDDAARALTDMGARNVIIKMGKDGSYVRGQECGTFNARPFEVKAVDSTGAGDVFDAALMYGVLRGMDMRRAAMMANAAGALSVTASGGTAAAPDGRELLEFIRSRREGS